MPEDKKKPQEKKFIKTLREGSWSYQLCSSNHSEAHLPFFDGSLDTWTINLAFTSIHLSLVLKRPKIDEALAIFKMQL